MYKAGLSWQRALAKTSLEEHALEGETNMQKKKTTNHHINTYIDGMIFDSSLRDKRQAGQSMWVHLNLLVTHGNILHVQIKYDGTSAIEYSLFGIEQTTIKHDWG